MSSLNTAELYQSEKLIDAALKVEDRDTLYRVIPNLYTYFKSSEKFVDEVKEFLKNNKTSQSLVNLKHNFSIATQKMEGYAQPAFIRELEARDEEQKLAFIRSLGMPMTESYSAEVEFERIPELDAEKNAGGIDINSSVLILGAGSISISGLFFASFGAQVRLLDRDPEAYDNFLLIEPFLPKTIQEKIILEPVCDARDYVYPENLTHILIAGLLEPKNPVLEGLARYYAQNPHVQKPRILMRVPKENLFLLFYYEADDFALEGFKTHKIVDIGYEQSTYTYVLDIAS